MSAAPALDDLFAQLDAMRHALHAGDLEDVERLLNRHDHDVRAFLHADGGHDLASLLRAQLELQKTMQDARWLACMRMRA